MANPYAQYQNNSVMTASPQQLTLMLYNGAIKFCNLCIEALQTKDIQGANKYNLRIQDIIVELQSTLDSKYEISKQLHDMYEIIKILLVDGNIEKDEAKIQRAKGLIVELRDTWKQIIG